MKDLLLTPDGDLDCSGNGLQLVDGPARVAQQIQTALRTFFGEWEFNLDEGVPWFQSILGIKDPNLNDVDALLKKAILDIADVKAIKSFSMRLDTDIRKLYITAKVSTTFGDVAVEGNFP